MSLLAESVSGYLENASWIRRMFEAGGQLKARYGAENVYDFSLGNPDLPAPAAVVIQAGEEEMRRAGFGAGPIDATFNVISQIVSRARL